MPTVETRTPVVEVITSGKALIGIPVAHGLVMGVPLGVLVALLLWGRSPIYGAWGGVVGLITFMCGYLIAHYAAPCYEITRTVTPEPMPIETVAPVAVTTYADRLRAEREQRPQVPDKMGRFLRDCTPQPSQRALRRKGWSETEIASYRDILIKRGRAAWINDKDHKRGWKLL